MTVGSGATRQQRQAALREADLYVVTSESLSDGRTTLEIVDAVLAAGVRLLQLREKALSRRALLELAREVRRRTEAAGCLLFVNDHVDVALACGADGVHLGQDDLPLPDARRLGPQLLLGASAHDVEEALAAQGDDADYVNIGPIHPTGTKPEHVVGLGPRALSEIGGRLTVPFTCMGGLHLGNVDEVLDHGARIVAVVTAVTRAGDPAAAARALRERIRARRPGG